MTEQPPEQPNPEEEMRAWVRQLFTADRDRGIFAKPTTKENS